MRRRSLNNDTFVEEYNDQETELFWTSGQRGIRPRNERLTSFWELATCLFWKYVGLPTRGGKQRGSFCVTPM